MIETIPQQAIKKENKILNNANSCPEALGLHMCTSRPVTFSKSISGPQAQEINSMPIPSDKKLVNVSVEDLLSSGAFKVEADDAVNMISIRTGNVPLPPPSAIRGSSSIHFSPQVMESDPHGTIRMRALNQGSNGPSLNRVKRPSSLDMRAARSFNARAGSLPPDPCSYTEQMITNYLHMRQILANGGGSYKPHLWPEPQRNPPWDKTPTVYSQVNPPLPSNRGDARSTKFPTPPITSHNTAQSYPNNIA